MYLHADFQTEHLPYARDKTAVDLFNFSLFCLLFFRALEKVDKEQLNRKRFEIYQTISFFGAFLLYLSLHNFTKLISKSVKLTSFIEMVIKSNFVKFADKNLDEPLEPLLNLFSSAVYYNFYV